MKTCKKYQKFIIEDIYNELSSDLAEKLKIHIKACEKCRREYSNMKAILGVMDKRERPEFKEEYWEQLEEKILNAAGEKTDRLKKISGLSGRRITLVLYAVAASLLIFIGIFLGKIFYSPQDPVMNTSPDLLNASVTSHFNNLKPLLLECSNYQVNSGENIFVGRENLKLFLMQNYLLKKAIKNSKDPALLRLVEDLELILIEISNRNPDNPRAFFTIQQQIENQDILFKISNFGNKKNIKPVI